MPYNLCHSQISRMGPCMLPLRLKSDRQLRCALQPPVAASEYADALQRIPQLSDLGPVFKSAEPLLLTEEETEYSIALVAHIFEAHVLLQFNCSNTVAEQVLENVNVVVDLSEAVRMPLLSQKYPLNVKGSLRHTPATVSGWQQHPASQRGHRPFTIAAGVKRADPGERLVAIPSRAWRQQPGQNAFLVIVCVGHHAMSPEASREGTLGVAWTQCRTSGGPLLPSCMSRAEHCACVRKRAVSGGVPVPLWHRGGHIV